MHSRLDRDVDNFHNMLWEGCRTLHMTYLYYATYLITHVLIEIIVWFKKSPIWCSGVIPMCTVTLCHRLLIDVQRQVIGRGNKLNRCMGVQNMSHIMLLLSYLSICFYIWVILYAPVKSHTRAPYGLLPGYSRAVLNKNRTSTHGACTGPVRRRTNCASPYGAHRVLIHRTYFDILNSPWTAHAGPYGPRTAKYGARAEFCQFWLYQFPYASIRLSYGAFAGPARAPYGSRRIWKTLKIPLRGPYDARAGIARDARGVMRIIRQNHKCTAAPSSTGPVAWCDHENSADVKFLRARHLALRARNRTDIVRGPWLDVTEALRTTYDSFINLLIYRGRNLKQDRPR